MNETGNTPRREPSAPSSVTIKRLFASSGNRCAFPMCSVNICKGDSIIGEICHIKARMPGGPRYDGSQSIEERHGYDNLILLCPNHHAVIDADTEAYTVERLKRMKNDHERLAVSITSDIVDQGTKLLIDQSVTAINQSGGITAHTVNINVDAGPPMPASTAVVTPWERNRKAYTEDLRQTARQVVHSQMTLEGRLALRHLMHHEQIEVGRTFLIDIPQDRLHRQLGIAKQSGIVQHKQVKEGMVRTYWIVNPQFRPILEEVLYEDGGA